MAVELAQALGGGAGKVSLLRLEALFQSVFVEAGKGCGGGLVCVCLADGLLDPLSCSPRHLQMFGVEPGDPPCSRQSPALHWALL